MIDIGQIYHSPNGNIFMRVSRDYEVYLGNKDSTKRMRSYDIAVREFSNCKSVPMTHEELTKILKRRYDDDY